MLLRTKKKRYYFPDLGTDYLRQRSVESNYRNGEDRPSYHLPLSKTAMKWLPERKEANDSDKVFNDLPSASGMNSLIHEWAEAAGITYKNVSYHTSRHTFGTMMITLGVDLYTVSKLMGHTNSRLQKYTLKS